MRLLAASSWSRMASPGEGYSCAQPGQALSQKGPAILAKLLQTAQERPLSGAVTNPLNDQAGRTAGRLFFGSFWPVNEPAAREGAPGKRQVESGLSRVR